MSVVPKQKRPRHLTIMAHDPGSTNYGACVLRASSASGGLKPDIKIKILTNGMCRILVNQLKDGAELKKMLRLHNMWALRTRQKYEVQYIVAERYMARGGKGPVIEAVNMMLGALVCNISTPCKVIPASQWKNAVRRAGVELSEWYKWAKVTPHQLDACLIAVYMSSTLYGHKGFDGLDLKKQMKGLILQMEKTSRDRLINRKTRK